VHDPERNPSELERAVRASILGAILGLLLALLTRRSRLA
jgi:hypothetical protein